MTNRISLTQKLTAIARLGTLETLKPSNDYPLFIGFRFTAYNPDRFGFETIEQYVLNPVSFFNLILRNA